MNARRPSWQVLAAALAVLTFLALTAAALSPDHAHPAAAKDACAACQLGHLSPLQPYIAADARPPHVATADLSAAQPLSLKLPATIEHLPSRGPPAA